jgi:hypothetical protein
MRYQIGFDFLNEHNVSARQANPANFSAGQCQSGPAHADVNQLSIDNAAKLRQLSRIGVAGVGHYSQGVARPSMKKLIALGFALCAFAAFPAMAQQIEYDIYDKSDFAKQIASNKPVLVHVNTTW